MKNNNNLNKILEMFNLSYKEEFRLEYGSRQKYRFNLSGLEFYDKDLGWCEVPDNTLEYMILGDYEIITNWLPKKDEVYYFPNISKGEPCISTATWKDTILDNTRYEAHMIFKTQDEALNCAEEIFEFLAKK